MFGFSEQLPQTVKTTRWPTTTWTWCWCFRVRSTVAARFRQWAADKLKKYITKGFILDDERLKNPQAGNDYFEELTRRIQDIRTSFAMDIQLASFLTTKHLCLTWNRTMASIQHISKTLKPYAEVRKDFSEALRQLWLTQGPVTLEQIQRIQQSRKYAHSPVSAMKRA